MEELYRDLYECPQNGTTEEAVEEKAHRWKWMAGIFLAGLCMVGIVLAGIYMRSSKTSVAGKLEDIRKEKPVETIKSKSKTYRMIRVEGMKRKEAAGALQQLADSSLEIIWKRKYSSIVKKGGNSVSEHCAGDGVGGWISREADNLRQPGKKILSCSGRPGRGGAGGTPIA